MHCCSSKIIVSTSFLLLKFCLCLISLDRPAGQTYVKLLGHLQRILADGRLLYSPLVYVYTHIRICSIYIVFQNTTFITITTATTTITATSTIASSSHRFISHIDITIATYYHSVTTSTNSNVNLPTVSVVGRHTTYNYLPSTEPTVSASSNDNNNSSVGVIVAIVTLVLAVFIVIAVVVVGIIVVWKGKKRVGHTKPEGVYYSTINETSLPRSPTSKPEPVYSEMNDGQDDKEPQYMDITDKAHPTEQADKVAMQDNPAYSTASEHQVELQDNPAYCTSFKHHA